MRSLSFLALAAFAAPVLAAPVLAAPAGFHADFRRDPARQGFAVQGDDDGRFAWRPGRHLAVSLDSNAPGARLAAPLGLSLDGSTSFRVEAEILLGSVDASPDDFFQLGFGLVSLSTTGLNRTGTSLPGPPFFVDDSDVFDSVEFDYYPNVTFFGGPFLQPTVFGAGSASSSAFANFAANFGSSADLGDNGPGEITELPVGRRLRVILAYDACSEELVTRILDVSGREPVELVTGLQPLDLSVLNATGTFHVDAFAVHAYQDLADFDPSTRSLAAEIQLHEAAVDAVPAPSARLVPRALNAAAGAPARILVEGAPEDAGITLVESGGLPVDVGLEVRVAGPHAFATLPADLASLPLALRVGDCLVPVDATAVPR